MATKLIQDQQKAKHLKTSKKILGGLTSCRRLTIVEKVVVSVGVGKMAKEKGKFELVADRLQRSLAKRQYRAALRRLSQPTRPRIGDTVGYQVTLRGKRAEDFLNRLVHIALPRTKDFKGIKTRQLMRWATTRSVSKSTRVP
jgi:large subunit ribosomal protein L5